MNPTNPLDQLRDIHLPEETIHWWPLAPGWWIIIVTVIILIIILSLWLQKRSLRQKKKKTHQKIIQTAIATLHHQTSPSQSALAQINQLIRRVALLYLPKKQASHISIATLAQHILSNHSKKIHESSLKLLDNAHYQPDIVIEKDIWQVLLNDCQIIIQQIPVYSGCQDYA